MGHVIGAICLPMLEGGRLSPYEQGGNERRLSGGSCGIAMLMMTYPQNLRF